MDSRGADIAVATPGRAPALTKAALLTAMRQRRVYATEDRDLRLVYRVNGQLRGSRIVGAGVPAAGTAVTVSLAITDHDEPNAGYTVEVFSDHAPHYVLIKRR